MATVDAATAAAVPAAKPPKQRSIRKKRAIEEQEALSEGEQDGEEQPKLTAEDIRLLQKQRQRRAGVDAGALAVADARPGGGAAGRLAAEVGAVAAAAAASQDVLRAAFKREQRLQSEEEDPHMKAYVEEQLAKRMGRSTEADEEGGEGGGARHPNALPEGLQQRQQDTELGPSWVTGIIEVPLTVDQKLKNIEDTEALKKRLLGGGRARGGGGGYGDDDDEGRAGGGGTRRGHFPVSFGRQDPKFLKVVAESQAKKSRMREFQEEKKRKKKDEFAGW